MISIILGGLFGVVSHIFVGSLLYLPGNMFYISMFLGIIFGLLIRLILDVNKLFSESETQ